jgi:ribonuclease HI
VKKPFFLFALKNNKIGCFSDFGTKLIVFEKRVFPLKSFKFKKKFSTFISGFTKKSKKFLCFIHKDKHYQFKALPFGLNIAPRIFTKVLKEVLKELREAGILLVAYLDDLLIIGECRLALQFTMELLSSKGFTLNLNKSQLKPTQKITFLGMEICSKTMQVLLPKEKLKSIKKELQKLSKKESVSARTIARVLGKLSAAPASLMARARVFHLNQFKTKHQKNWDKEVSILIQAKEELKWWFNQVETWNGKRILEGTNQLILETDASKIGWGAVLLDLDNKVVQKIQANWTQEENSLELQAVILATKAFKDQLQGKTILVKTDNVVTMNYINNLGGRKLQLSTQMAHFLEFLKPHRIILEALYNPGLENDQADKLSRKKDSCDWKLRTELFWEIQAQWGAHSIDLFANSQNHQLTKYCSWLEDPNAFAINAFSINWNQRLLGKVFAFPPPQLIHQVIKKAQAEGAQRSLVVPHWKGQSWWAILKKKAKNWIHFPCNSIQQVTTKLPSQFSTIFQPMGNISSSTIILDPQAEELIGNTVAASTNKCNGCFLQLFRVKSSKYQPIVYARRNSTINLRKNT